jgi:hypothetical protein
MVAVAEMTIMTMTILRIGLMLGEICPQVLGAVTTVTTVTSIVPLSKPMIICYIFKIRYDGLRITSGGYSASGNHFGASGIGKRVEIIY